MSQNEQINISKVFSEHFEIIPALSDELKEEAYRVRHHVYCEDLSYESQRENKCESDEYDANSLHLLLKSIKLNKFIGCTRLVRRSADNLYELLPFEKICSHTLDYSKINNLLRRDNIAEVSRLAVTSDFRRRKGEADQPVSISDEDYGASQYTNTRFPYVPLGLFYGTVELASVNHIDILFMLTEKRLASHFSKLGADLKFIGAPVEYHGLRIPSMIDTAQVIRDIKPLFRPLYQIISRNIHDRLAEFGIDSKESHVIDTNLQSKNYNIQQRR
ncbi:MAG: PEP-CTERM/exosortase system-associated acyltransferase [Nitrosomonas sp.]|nr:PEP-CTERM/exosortase system-associated acyltransferase [Nitrosomonas sp.]MBK7363783.1 PEP-CTERM/exosortase system-associated acyltransferase [Nitrosomonas sp.]